MTTKLFLPMPPTVNHYWSRAKNGAVYLTPKARAYKTEVLSRVSSRRIVFGDKLRFKNNERLKVTITLHFSTKAKNDLDNRLKGLLDALTKANIWTDDSQIDVLVVKRGNVVKGGRVVIEIDEIKEKTT